MVGCGEVLGKSVSWLHVQHGELGVLDSVNDLAWVNSPDKLLESTCEVSTGKAVFATAIRAATFTLNSGVQITLPKPELVH